MQIDYTAKRSLKSGHSVDTAYQIDIDLQQSDRIYNTVGVQHKSLSGNTITTIHRRDEFYSLSTEIVSSSTTPDQDDMREFLDSVVSGETFQLDITGSSENYILDSITSPYTETRLSNALFRYSFKVRKL